MMQNYERAVREASAYHLSAPIIANVRYFQNVHANALQELSSGEQPAVETHASQTSDQLKAESNEEADELKDKWVAANEADYKSFFFNSLKQPYMELEGKKADRDDSAHVLGMRSQDESSSHARDPQRIARTLSTRPSVYIVYFHRPVDDPDNPNKLPWTVYVGETNHIIKRTVQHVGKVDSGESEAGTSDERRFRRKRETRADRCITNAIGAGIEVRQFVIWQELFNKSLTLDIENKLIDYMHAIPTVNCLNGRTNPQGSYFTRDALDAVVSRIWGKLTSDNKKVKDIQRQQVRRAGSRSKRLPNLLPTEEHIWQSALYKISPFHRLGEGQRVALEEVKARVRDVLEGWGKTHFDSQLILVEGAAGTGKSILLSTLFYELSNMSDSPKTRVKLLIYNTELRRQYTKMAKLQGLFTTSPESEEDVSLCDAFDNVCNPSAFIHGLTSSDKDVEVSPGHFRYDYARPTGRCDVALVDEAHLLFTQGRQGYQGANQLFDILRRAKIVIAVFDPNQIMNSTQRWDAEQLARFLERAGAVEGSKLHAENALICDNRDARSPEPPTAYKVFSLRLSEQFRISASPAIEKWIRSFGSGLSNKIYVDDMASDKRPCILPIPQDDLSRDNGVFSDHSDWPFEIRVCDSPFEVEQGILDAQKRMAELAEKDFGEGRGSQPEGIPCDLCRMLATYDWRYTAAKGGFVTLYPMADGTWSMPDGWTADNRPIAPEGAVGKPFHRSWNDNAMENPVAELGDAPRGSKSEPWATREGTKREIGSYFTIQGSDLNYAGIIIGPSISYDLEHDHVVYRPEFSMDDKVNGDNRLQEVFIKNQFNVLLTRGIHGLFLFAVDAKLQKKLMMAQAVKGHSSF